MFLQLINILVMSRSLLLIEEGMPNLPSINGSWTRPRSNGNTVELADAHDDLVNDLFPARVVGFVQQLPSGLAWNVLHNDKSPIVVLKGVEDRWSPHGGAESSKFAMRHCLGSYLVPEDRIAVFNPEDGRFRWVGDGASRVLIVAEMEELNGSRKMDAWRG